MEEKAKDYAIYILLKQGSINMNDAITINNNINKVDHNKIKLFNDLFNTLMDDVINMIEVIYGNYKRFNIPRMNIINLVKSSINGDIVKELQESRGIQSYKDAEDILRKQIGVVKRIASDNSRILTNVARLMSNIITGQPVSGGRRHITRKRAIKKRIVRKH